MARILFWSVCLFLAFISVSCLRGALVRSGRAVANDFNGLSYYSSPGYQGYFIRAIQPKSRRLQEFMRFGRSLDNLPGAHQNFFRGRRDDSEEADLPRFG